MSQASPDFLAIPGAATSLTAQVRVVSTIADTARLADVALLHAPSGRRWPLAAWQTWSAPGDPRTFVHFADVEIRELQPDRAYPLHLVANGQSRPIVQVRTLPASVPPVGQPPLIVMLGSCFCRRKDSAGEVGRTFAQLPAGARPHLKILAGDQVYLDSPWYRFVPHQSPGTLGRTFLENYLSTWGQSGDQQGFQQLLGDGANYFCPDDHEFWNNAPFACTFASNTWTKNGRQQWRGLASDLYSIFQTDTSHQVLRVGDLEFLILDTRSSRSGPDDPEPKRWLMSQGDFDVLENWVTGLRGPGFLVLGQPIFAKEAGFLGRFADWNYPDFSQYRDLCRVLLSSRQTIVVLTGDVHYGRFASATLRSGAELIELISSPMALVDGSAGGDWNGAPDWFPTTPGQVPARRRVETERSWKRFANHFVTLELNATGAGLRLSVRSWETASPESVARGAYVIRDRNLGKVL